MKPEKEEEFESEEQEEGTDSFAEKVPEKEVEPTDEIVPSEVKNRQYRRLEQKYQAERESAIALNARLEALSEAQRFQKNDNIDENDAISRIYGVETPEAREATRLLQKALKETGEKATDAAWSKFREEQNKADQEVKRQQNVLDGMLETIEDEHGVDVTSNAPAARKNRQEFFKLLERLSPKQDGVVTDYADALETWDVLQKTKEKPSASRAKEFSNRSMVKSGTSTADDKSPEDKAAEKYLKDIGIL